MLAVIFSVNRRGEATGDGRRGAWRLQGHENVSPNNKRACFEAIIDDVLTMSFPRSNEREREPQTSSCRETFFFFFNPNYHKFVVAPFRC